MKTVLSHDPQGWLRDAQIGKRSADEHVIQVYAGPLSVTLTAAPVSGGETEFELTYTEFDQVIEGLLAFRAAHKIDRVRRDRVQAGIRDAANRRRAS